MAVIYSNNFDSTTAGTVPTGWTSITGQPLIVHATEAISGVNSFGLTTATTSSKTGTSSYTAMTAQAFMCVYFEFIMHDRADGTNSSIYSPTVELCYTTGNYYSMSIAPKTTSGNSFASISKVVGGLTNTTWNGGSTGPSGSTFGTGYADGSVICCKFEVTNATNPIVHFKIWTKGTTEPAGWLITATDNSGASLTGKATLIVTNATTAILTPLASVDNLYIADSAADIPLVGGAVTTTNIQATQVDLSWTAPTTGATPYTYDVLRSLNSNMASPTTLVSGQSGRTYSDTTVSANTTYYYQIVYHDNVQSANSNILPVTTSSGLPATTYSVTMPTPSSGPQNIVSSSISLQLNGTVGNGNTVIIHGTDDQGVSTTTATITGTGNTPGAALVTYTPTVPGTRTITWTHTGTQTGITDPGTTTYDVIAVISPGGIGYHESPGNWNGAASRIDNTAGRNTWNPSAYIICKWTDTSATPTAPIFYGDYLSNGAGNTITYWLDGNLVSSVPLGAPGATPSSTSITLSGIVQQANFQHMLVICLNSSNSQVNRFDNTNGLRFFGVQLSSTATPTVIAPVSGWVMMWGDSITESLPACVVGGSAAGYAGLIAQAFIQRNYDVCVSACSGNGWITTGGNGDVLALYSVVSGVYNAGNSRWNKISKIGGTAVSVLDSNNHISAYGATGQEPTIIYVNMGTNEQLHNGSVSDTQISVQKALLSWRQAAPNARIIVQIPFGLYNNAVFSANAGGNVGTDYVTAIKAGFAAYQSATPDAKAEILDFGTWLSNLIPSATTTSDPADVHPNAAGHAIIAPYVMLEMQKQIDIANGTGGTGGNNGGGYRTRARV